VALPKTRHSPARQGERRAHLALKQPASAVCPQCKQRKRPHAICPNCGYYRGREIIKTE